MDAISVMAVTATRQQRTLNTDTPIPPTDLLVLHSPAKLSLYTASRHVCDIRLRVPGLDDSLSPYLGFLSRSHAVPKAAESPGGSVLKYPIHLLRYSPHHELPLKCAGACHSNYKMPETAPVLCNEPPAFFCECPDVGLDSSWVVDHTVGWQHPVEMSACAASPFVWYYPLLQADTQPAVVCTLLRMV